MLSSTTFSLIFDVEVAFISRRGNDKGLLRPLGGGTGGVAERVIVVGRETVPLAQLPSDRNSATVGILCRWRPQRESPRRR